MMSKRDQLEVVVELTVDHKEREVSKRKPANSSGGTDTWNGAPGGGMIRYELNDVLNLTPKTISKARTFRFVPTQVVANL